MRRNVKRSVEVTVQICERFHDLVEGHIGLESANPICPSDSRRQATFSLPTNPRLLECTLVASLGNAIGFCSKKTTKDAFCSDFFWVLFLGNKTRDLPPFDWFAFHVNELWNSRKLENQDPLLA